MDSINLQTLALSLRAGAYFFAVFLLFLVWFRSPKKTLKYSFTFLNLCLAGYLFLYLAPNWLFAPFYLLNLLLPTALSLVVLSVFGDRLFLMLHGGAAFIIFAAGLVYILSDPPLHSARVIAFVANAALSIFALRNSWLNFKDDLNDRRKRWRLTLGFVVLAYVLGAAFLSLLLSWDSSVRETLRLAEGAVLLVAMFALNLLSINSAFSGSFFGMDSQKARAESDFAPPSSAEALKAGQSQDEEKILRFVDLEKSYLEAGLSLEELAKAVGLPQHRVRHVLNQRLGYENFNDFLNHYRVEHAARLFATPEGASAKIFAIAIQSGFSSLAPFNRAFKKRFGVPPSDYRSALKTGVGSLGR